VSPKKKTDACSRKQKKKRKKGRKHHPEAPERKRSRWKMRLSKRISARKNILPKKPSKR
jgi:hypothetical protein